jgi:hypothetical protein
MQKNLATIGAPARAGGDDDAWENHAAVALRNELPRLRYALIEVKLEKILRRLAPAVGRDPAALHQWPRARDGALEIPTLASLKSNVAALRFQLVLFQFAWRERKAGFDPNQLRVPRGQPDGGQWSDAGGGGGSDGDSGSGGGDRAPLRITIHPRPRGEGNGPSLGSAPLGEPPKIHIEEPESRRVLNVFIKQAAYWLAEAVLLEVANPAVGPFVGALKTGYLAYKAYPYIKAYLDRPKTLDELQSAALNPARGYDVHHIVEQTPAEQDGFPRWMIDAPENLVRIPTLKHWQITGWYMTPNEDYGNISPRAYLRGKNWDERKKAGHDALVDFGVLKP